MTDLHDSLPAAKQTALKLYVTSQEAYKRWQADPEVIILDVRTPEEYLFVGHPPAAGRIQGAPGQKA